jgi:hypothetical protein
MLAIPVSGVRCYSNNGQNVAVPRMSALCHSRPMHGRKMFFASTNIQNKAALRELRDCEV